MHFSKTYTQLLLTLPPELRDNAIEYRKLKKLIHDIVNELDAIGLNPEVLHQLLSRDTHISGYTDEKRKARAEVVDEASFPKVVYEFSTSSSDRIEPRLHFWIPSDPAYELHEADMASPPDISGSESPDSGPSEGEEAVVETESLLHKLQRGVPAANESGGEDERASAEPSEDKRPAFADSESLISRFGTHDLILDKTQEGAQQVIVPLVTDTAFYTLLSSAIDSIAAHLEAVHAEFLTTLQSLSRAISDTARPLSATSSFTPHSQSADAGAVRAPLFFSALSLKSDLYAWREIFQLYVEAEVFESMNERARGERTVEDAEGRLKAFAERVTGHGLGDQRTLKLKESRAALETFLRLNLLLLNLKKFQVANTEATRKILKKHAKRTALPLPSVSASSANYIRHPQGDPVTLTIPSSIASLPRTLVQAVSETLLPIIPHVDDYACLICTSIAFKPIRLFCGHLFCLRCLVKMQKRGKGNCPMCRAPTVLQADRSNVDWALLNFMQDWFPEESKDKLRSNEREAAEEEMAELGINAQGCIIG